MVDNSAIYSKSGEMHENVVAVAQSGRYHALLLKRSIATIKLTTSWKIVELIVVENFHRWRYNENLKLGTR